MNSELLDKSSLLDQVIEINVLSFYGWWQLTVCLFAFVALIGIWWHIGRKLKEYGQIWLAISVLFWALSGGVEVYYSGQYKQELKEILNASGNDGSSKISELKSQENIILSYQQSTVLLNGWRSVFSLFNSLFILLALPYFKYIPDLISGVVKSMFWIHIIGWPFMFSLLPTITKMFNNNDLGLMSELDVYFSMFTIVFMGLVLFESFTNRRLKILAFLSVVCCLVTLLAQIYKLTSLNVNLTLYSAIFKTSLIMIFFALALSWVKELTENIIPEARNLSLKLSRVKKGNKFEHQVFIKGFLDQKEILVIVTQTLFNLISRFAEKRIEGEGWLEIRPKSDTYPDKNYDIKDHNEIKRLVVALLDGIFGKGLWTKSKHEEPLKTTLFEMSEKRERKIRLAIPKSNISLEI